MICQSSDSSSSGVSSDSSSSCVSMDSLSPWTRDRDNNGLFFAPNCDDLCFLREVGCNHNHHQVSLNHVGKYVAFPSMWYHHGYFSAKRRKTVIQAQLFAMHTSNPTAQRSTQLGTKMDTFIEGRMDRLDELTKDLAGNWNTTYSKNLFPPAKSFDGGRVNPEKNRHIPSDKYDQVPKLENLVRMFERKFNHLCIDSVWLILKDTCEDGFQGWHRDFALGAKITTTIVINVGSYKEKG